MRRYGWLPDEIALWRYRIMRLRCRLFGHLWEFTGGCACPYAWPEADCSIAVYECGRNGCGAFYHDGSDCDPHCEHRMDAE